MEKRFFKRIAPLAALAMGTALSGCNYVIDWEHEVTGVALAELDTSGSIPSQITLAGPDKIIISDGEELSITLDGDAEAGEALRFDLDGDELTIARDSKVYKGSKHAIVRITLPSPEALTVAGSGTIEAESMAGDAEIDIAGSGKINVSSLTAQRLSVDIAGAGDVTAAGTAERLSVGIAGSGDVDLKQLKAVNVSVEIAGSGDVEVASDGEVKADIAGSGDVTVIGSAKCSLNKAGSGSLTCNPAPATTEADAE
jgi:hypothetical protein